MADIAAGHSWKDIAPRVNSSSPAMDGDAAALISAAVTIARFISIPRSLYRHTFRCALSHSLDWWLLSLIRLADIQKRMHDSLNFKSGLGKMSAGIVSLSVILALSGCIAGSEPVAGPLSGEFEGNSAVSVLQNINNRALSCWIKSGDKDFEGFALVPELDTRSGRPRILIVKKGQAQGLPQMVIEASGKPVKLNTYGPLTQQRLSGRINSDIIAWNTGRTGCVSSA